jgi:hypothetical protein
VIIKYSLYHVQKPGIFKNIPYDGLQPVVIPFFAIPDTHYALWAWEGVTYICFEIPMLDGY